MDKRDEAAERYAAEQERVLRKALGDEGYELLEELVLFTMVFENSIHGG